MQVALAGDKDFNVNTPPFMIFFVDRVLAKMREKDQEAARGLTHGTLHFLSLFADPP